MVLSFASLKNEKLRNILDGTPSFIIKHGIVNYQEMVKQKYNLDDLLTQLREKGERNIEDIEYAILENNGSLSVFPYNDKHEKTPVPLPIILDGKIQTNTVLEIGKNMEYINRLLENKKMKLEDIFYAFYKDNNIFLIKYKDL